MNFTLSKNESEKIKNHFGQAFYEKLLKNIDIYSEMWQLEIVKLVDYFSVNCILVCRSALYGDAVLKIGNPCKETITEYNTLLEYNGNRFCKVLNADIDNGVILEELIQPGIQLRTEKSLEKRLAVFSDLYRDLHIKSVNPDIYPTYVGWVTRITDYMEKRDDFKELCSYMKKAREICLNVSSKFNQKMLLHGDFHQDNILLNSTGGYTIIDPKGVIGDPVFDVPRFLLNENNEDETPEQNEVRIKKAIDYLSCSLNIPSAIIKQCYFIETVMAYCWCVESNEEPDMICIKTAERIINE
ncbi:MAG: hypothetical protein A2Y17_01845 [Clostridiales bacterium GWF2_38_85]|nr:MAG: hypothetical protein A2Y17_01845 [Clostridiales bacterium GWF2_38_85]HBL84747.1 aminoglycoside resistance protein [Clostridiales bacterium]